MTRAMKMTVVQIIISTNTAALTAGQLSATLFYPGIDLLAVPGQLPSPI